LAFDIIIVAVLTVITFLIRAWIVSTLKGASALTIIPNILGLRYSENTGAAFSMLSTKTALLSVITLVALLVMAYMIFVKKYGAKLERAFLIMIFTGGLCNLIERVFFGYVVDYFEFLFVRFAIFNFADSLITVGVALLLIYTIIAESKKNEHQ
jgi:signal peptidase II